MLGTENLHIYIGAFAYFSFMLSMLAGRYANAVALLVLSFAFLFGFDLIKPPLEEINDPSSEWNAPIESIGDMAKFWPMLCFPLIFFVFPISRIIADAYYAPPAASDSAVLGATADAARDQKHATIARNLHQGLLALEGRYDAHVAKKVRQLRLDCDRIALFWRKNPEALASLRSRYFNSVAPTLLEAVTLMAQDNRGVGTMTVRDLCATPGVTEALESIDAARHGRLDDLMAVLAKV